MVKKNIKKMLKHENKKYVCYIIIKNVNKKR